MARCDGIQGTALSTALRRPRRAGRGADEGEVTVEPDSGSAGGDRLGRRAGNYRQRRLRARRHRAQDFMSAAIGDRRPKNGPRNCSPTGGTGTTRTVPTSTVRQGPKTLKTALETTRGLKMASGDRTCFAKVVIDALANGGSRRAHACEGPRPSHRGSRHLISGFRSSLRAARYHDAGRPGTREDRTAHGVTATRVSRTCRGARPEPRGAALAWRRKARLPCQGTA